MSITKYGNYLKELHKRAIVNKDDNSLIMPALCIPNATSKRATDNAIWGRHVYLDFDDTELSPISLSRIFPYIETITYNSYSNSSNGLRYRAIFFTDDIVSPQTYTFLWRQIVQRIENAGYQGSDNYYPKVSVSFMVSTTSGMSSIHSTSRAKLGTETVSSITTRKAVSQSKFRTGSIMPHQHDSMSTLTLPITLWRAALPQN